MEEFEFRYNDRRLTVKIFGGTFLTFFALNIITVYTFIQINSEMLYRIISFVGEIAFLGFLIYGFFGTNFKGIGILHDKYFEIKLKDKQYRIKYTEIEKIRDRGYSSRHWHIYVHGKPEIIIYQGLSFFGIGNKTNLYPLETFMRELYKRLELKQYTY